MALARAAERAQEPQQRDEPVPANAPAPAPATEHPDECAHAVPSAHDESSTCGAGHPPGASAGAQEKSKNCVLQ